MRQLKLFLYRISLTPIGKRLLGLLSFGIQIQKSSKTKKQPFIIVITTDTEAGYVKKNQERIWQGMEPSAYQGFYHGIGNLLSIFEKHKIKTTFFLSTHCFSAPKKEYDQIIKILEKFDKNGYEIGLHLHPDSDKSLQQKLKRKFNASSAIYYNLEEKKQLLKTARLLIKEHLGVKTEKKLTSFRWGNWALDSDGVKALEENGFFADSSATPGIKGHLNDPRQYDWSQLSLQTPFFLNKDNYQSTNNANTSVLELPIATFSFFGITLRADPVNSELLIAALKKYHAHVDRSTKPFIFVVLTHSSEACYRDGSITPTAKDLDTFIREAKKSDVTFMTIKEAAKLWLKTRK